jgi:hypothetical protein
VDFPIWGQAFAAGKVERKISAESKNSPAFAGEEAFINE